MYRGAVPAGVLDRDQIVVLMDDSALDVAAMIRQKRQSLIVT
jgi:hypothetical protein